MYFVAKFNILKFKIRILTNSQSLFNAIVVRYKNYVEVIDENIDEKYDGEIKITEETLDKYIDKSKLPVEFNNTNLFFRNFYIGDFDFTGNSANILVEKQNSLFMFEDFITIYFSVFFINHNISLIHCSALCDKNNNVYIFFGGSGAGKSTLTANRKNLQLISEDHIIVEKIDLKKSSYYRINKRREN